jgi:hypothetical protein
MGSTVLTRHVCDKCGNTREVPGGEGTHPAPAPEDWARLQLYTGIPWQGIVEHGRSGAVPPPECIALLLCHACAAAVREHIGRPRKSRAQQAAEMPLGSTDG